MNEEEQKVQNLKQELGQINSPNPSPAPQSTQPAAAPAQSPAPKPPKKSNLLIWVGTVILLLALVAVGVYFLQTSDLLKLQISPSPSPSPSPQITPTPEPTSNWQVYSNSEYGFQIKYPAGYQALDDEESLYGWPKAIVLFYKGGQSHDLAIEVWDNQDDYLEKYKNTEGLVVKEVGGKYLTLLNNNNTDEVKAIIETFELVGSEKIYCSDPRPDACTLEYLVPPPYICGSNNKAYSNKCLACADSEVEWYVLQEEICSAD